MLVIPREGVENGAVAGFLWWVDWRVVIPREGVETFCREVLAIAKVM